MDFTKLREFAPSPRELAWGLGGLAMAGIVTVSAQQAASSGDAPPCPISDSIQQAINSKVQLVGVTGTDVSKYFAVGSAQSCIDSLLNTSFDLSKLIPDPIGWLSDAAQFAIRKATEAAVGKVCTAARNSMGDIIGKYNQATGLVTGWKSAIDTNIAGQSVASYGTSYSQPTSIKDVLAEVPANTMPTTSGTSGTSGTIITNPSGTSGTTITSGVPAPVTNPTPFTTPPAAAPNPQTYQTAPQSQQSQPAQPVTPATVGTSVFGR